MATKSEPNISVDQTSGLKTEGGAKTGLSNGMGRSTNADENPAISPTDQQTRAATQSADNDMDRMTNSQHNLAEDADEAQSDGNIGFPPSK